MKRMRQFIPSGLYLLGVTLITLVGISVAAQDQNESKSIQPPSQKTVNPKAGADQVPPLAGFPQPEVKRDAPMGQHAVALGAQLEAKGDQGLSVNTIEQNGVLGHAGLKQNDLIISVDGRAFNDPRQFEAYLWGQSGRAVPLIVERGGERQTIHANIPPHATSSGWLGVFLAEGEPKVQGARVTQVYPSSPAARAGIEVGDLIKQVDARQITSSAEAVMLIRQFRPKDEVVFVIERGHNQLKIPVIIGTRGHLGNQNVQANPQQIAQPGQHAATTGTGPDGMHQFDGVPPYAMQLENDRRMAEQHERIEEELRLLRVEVQKLRELIEKK